MFQEWLFNVSAPFILRGKDKKYCGIMALSSSQVLKQDTLHTAVQVGSSILHSTHQYYFLLTIPRYIQILEELPHRPRALQ